MVRAEIFKLTRKTSIRILFAISLLWPLILSVLLVLSNPTTPVNYDIMFVSDFARAGVESIYILYSPINIFSLLTPVLAAIVISGEFGRKTISSSLCRGGSRTDLYISKLIVVFVGSIVFILIAYIVYTAVLTARYGFLNSSGFEVSQLLKILQLLFALITSFAAYASLFCLIAFICRNIVFTLVVENILLLIEDNIIGLFSDSSNIMGTIYNFFPKKYIDEFMQDNTTNMGISILLSVGIVIITTIIGCYVLEKKDIE